MNFKALIKPAFIAPALLMSALAAEARRWDGIDRIDFEPEMAYALSIIENTYGDIVSVDDKKKSLFRFGRNVDVDTSAETLMPMLGAQTEETYSATNNIQYVASAAADTVVVTVEGHTISGNELTFVSQNVTLTGTTPATLTTPLARITFAYNAGAVNLTGPVYFSSENNFSAGVPQVSSHSHLIIPSAHNNSEKGATSTSKRDYWIITSMSADVLERNTSFASVELQVRTLGGVFREIASIEASNTNEGILNFKPYLIVPKNSDVRLQATANTTDIDVAGDVQGYLAIIQ